MIHNNDAHLVKVDENEVFAITRPDDRLLPLFVIYAVLSTVGFIVMMPFLYFRFITLRYRFDQEGIAVSYGLLWRKETYLTYARIQDIHVSRNIFERWLGLGTVEIQTAAGSSSAEQKIQGVTQYETIRNFLYARMRGHIDAPSVNGGPTPVEETLLGIRNELQAIREHLTSTTP